MTFVERFANASSQTRRKHGPIVDDQWERVWSLPRREWTNEEMQAEVDRLSTRLRKDGSNATLFPVQAAALAEIERYGGFVGALIVGAGKTLISLLAPIVVGARRPLLILPAKLEKKTHEEVVEYRRDWNIPRCEAISIEKLRRVAQADFLTALQPDMIVIDEAHRLANFKASAAQRIDRYVREYSPNVVVLTGTLTNEELREYAHFMRWALGDCAPVPTDTGVVRLWSEALAEPPKSALGAFCRFGDLDGARDAYRQRLLSTPGVMVTSYSYDAPLEIVDSGLEPSRKCLDAIAEVENTWTLPDEQPIADPLQMARACYTLALGYWLRWRVPGPPEWMAARREWAAFVREECGKPYKEPIDTEEQCRIRIQDGLLPEGEEILNRWLDIRDSFTPEPIVEWLDDSGVELVRQWCAKPGIVWYRHRAIGEACEAAGVPHYGRQGLDRFGRPIESARADLACIASMRSSGEGRNLQQFHRMLVLEPPSKATPWEQLIGRMHRNGQTMPVRVEVYAPTARHREMMRRAIASARYVEQSIGQPQKLTQFGGY